VPGAKNCILDKNVDGLYAEEPRKNPDAEQIKDITAAGLINIDLGDLVIGRVVLIFWQTRSISVKYGSSSCTGQHRKNDHRQKYRNDYPGRINPALFFL